MITVGMKSDTGAKRDDNQDSFYVSENNDILLYLVADGMGGHKAGKMASTMASSVSVLIEKPNISIKKKVPIRETGTAMAGIRVDLKS